MSGNLFSRLRAAMPGDLRRRFARLPDRGAEYTYRDVLDVSGRFANALLDLGVEPDDRVAVQAEKSIECLILYLAALRAGAVYLPLNTAYTPAEIEYFLSDAEPRVFVCDPVRAEALAPIADKAGARLETLGPWQSPDVSAGSFADRGLAAPTAFNDAERSANDLAAILYTSGTTGRSKGAMLTHGNLASNAEALVETWRFTDADVLLHALPIFHTHGLFVATNTIMLAGGSMIFMPRFDLDAIMAELPGATTMMGVPTFYSRLLSRPDLTRDFVAHIRLFISGSAPLSAEVHKEFAARTGHALLERYGMTETGMNTSNPYDGERRPGTVGVPLPGVDLRIADPETGRELPHGDVGVIEVHGPNVFKGYWRNPEKTAEEFRPDGFFITGDLAMLDPDRYVMIVGRAKDLIISGGFNVYPAEVEAALDQIEGVAESAVIGVRHHDLGEGVTGVVSPKPGANLREDEMRGQLTAVLAKYKVPKRILVLDQLPRNTMGKVQKNVLREMYGDLYAGRWS